MWLTSNDFADKGKFPRACTCGGDDLSPALTWGEAPPQTRGFALICNDPDAQVGVCRHWSAYDNPGQPRGWRAARDARHRRSSNRRSTSGEPSTAALALRLGKARTAIGFGCLRFRMAACRSGKGARCRNVEREAQKHMLAEVELVGTFER